MKDLILATIIWLIALGMGNATADSTPGVSYVHVLTTNSTPVTVFINPTSQYFTDMSYRVINTNAAGVTGNLLITDGGVTICNDSPAPGQGGWDDTIGWTYPAPVVNGSYTNNTIIATDTQGIGLNIQFKFWCGTSRANRPE